jgi:hypothetical protein
MHPLEHSLQLLFVTEFFQVSVEKRKMVMGSYIDQKNAMELAIASGKAVFTGPQAAVFNAMRINGMAPPVFVQTPAADGARALPSTFPLHVRATALIGSATVPMSSPSSLAQTSVKCAADNAAVHASSPTSPTVPIPHHAAAHTGPRHASHVPPQSLPKPLLSFHAYSSAGAHESIGHTVLHAPQQAQPVPLLPASTLLSSDPSHFEAMLKDWSRKVAGQSFGAGSAARAAQPAASQPAVSSVDVDDDVLCIDSPKVVAADAREMVSGIVDAPAGDVNEIICVSSSDSESEHDVSVIEDNDVVEDNSVTTPLLTAQQQVQQQLQQANSAEPAPSAHRTGETNPPTCNLTPRSILNFFSPIKKSCADACSPEPGSSGTSASAAAFNSAIPPIVNPVFTEVLAAAPATSLVDSAAADAHLRRPSNTSRALSASGSNRAAAPENAVVDCSTFPIVVSTISGRNMSVDLSRRLLQRSALLLPMDDARGGNESPVEEPSSIVSAAGCCCWWWWWWWW